jgi:hypothetical protein
MNEYRQKAQEVLLSSIDQTGFESCEYYNPESPIKFCHDRFLAEYGHEVSQVGTQKAVTNWLQGLALAIPFYNDDIKATFNIEDKHLDNYWSYMASTLIQMWDN